MAISKSKFRSRVAVGAALAVPAIMLAAPVQAQVAGDKIPGAYICVFNSSVAKGDVEGQARGIVGAAGGQVDHVYKATIRGFAARLPAQAIARMREHNPNIAYCEQDQVVTLVPIRAEKRPGGGGGTPQPAQTTPWGITRVNGGGAGSFQTAWVIDTGINFSHPDLNVDTLRSASFLGRRTTGEDQNGHGTHVAGTIAAKANTIGVIGVAPGAAVVAVRVLDASGSGTNSGVIAGVDYVGANGQAGDVANMSLGGGISTALDSAVVLAAAGGVRFSLAAGNSSADANFSSPARANGPNVYTVSAFSVGDNFATFSNFGNPPIDYAEPGVGVNSTWLNGGYNTISGTSMAAPHLAGLLLAGPVNSGGTVNGDADANPDTIGVH